MTQTGRDFVCPQCKSNGQILFSLKKKRELLRCFSCDLIYVKNNKGASNGHCEDGKKFLNEYLMQENLYSDYFERKAIFIEKYKKGSTLLDVGCGAGVFLGITKKMGWKVMGVDPSETAAVYAKRLGFPVEQTSFEKIGINHTKFDVVTMFQTLEHVEDPVAFLNKSRGLLNNGGLILLTTPNRESLLGNIFGKRWFGYYNEEHLHFFNKKSLEFALKKAGFVNIEIQEEWGRVLTPSWVLTRLSDYYYDHRSLVRKAMTSARPFWKYLDWIKFKEPMVNLVAVARYEK